MAIIAAAVAVAHLAQAEPAVPPKAAPARLHISSPEVKSWCMLFQVMRSLEDAVGTKELGAIHNEDTLLSIALTSLQQAARQPGRDPTEVLALLKFSRAVGDLHAAADAFDQPRSEARLAEANSAFEEAKRFCKPEALKEAQAQADHWTCPMHPDIAGKKGEECPKCGMPLDQMIRPQPFENGGTSPPNILKAEIRTSAPLETGQEAEAILVLRRLFTNEPVPLSELREVHTEKIHLLIVDSSLTDYHHEHPRPNGNPGEYAFRFTPTKPGPYRAWADVRPNLTGMQEYVMTDIAAQSAGEPLADKATVLSASGDGLRYELSFGDAEPKVAQPITARLRIAAADGKPCDWLEPIMDAFAHIVAFHEDGKTVIHSHPRGARILRPEDRGGPELEFQFYATRAGFHRVFAQVQIGGKSKFAKFGINVTE